MVINVLQLFTHREICADGVDCYITKHVHETFWAETETRPRDPCLRDRNETETFNILSETRPRRDVAASVTLAETLYSLGSFNVSPRRFPWRMVKHIDIDMDNTD